MKPSHSVAVMVVAAFLLALGATNNAYAQAGVKAGILKCRSVLGTKRNLLVYSTQKVTCVFESTDGSIEHYGGKTGIGFGIDLQLESNETLVYAVLSGTGDRGKSTLAGRYVGVEASAEIGVGGTAAVLIGGGNDSVTLQPIALGVRAGGVGVSAGVGYLNLAPVTARSGIRPALDPQGQGTDGELDGG